MSEQEYDIALSFAGEDRGLADALANALRQNGVRVFYDEFERAKLWGKDLYVHLQEIYRDRAKFCVVLASQHYANKIWTKHELRQAQARALAQNDEYILPLRLDSTELPGLNNTTSYIDAVGTPIERIVELLLEKLGLEGASLNARLRRAWDGQFIEQDGVRMVSYWPRVIAAEQENRLLTFKVNLQRLRYGEESRYRDIVVKAHCRDCAVATGSLHVMNCAVEECPNCNGQLISCGCRTLQDQEDDEATPERATLYGIRTHAAVKRAADWLDKNEILFIFHDAYELGIDEAALSRWMDEYGWENLLNRRAAFFRTISKGRGKRLTRKLAERAILTDPRVIAGPILELGGKVVVGFDAERFKGAAKAAGYYFYDPETHQS